MSRDPYIDVKREVEQNLNATTSLLSEYTSSDTNARYELEEELENTIQNLEADVADLEESVRIVEATGDKWGLGEEEVRTRRRFVQRVKGQLGDLQRRVTSTLSSRGKGKGKEREVGGYRDLPEDAEGGDEDEQKQWEMEEQQTLMRRQDDTLGYISGTLSTLASQAGLIGHEVSEQSEMLDDLGNRVDNTDSRLRKVQRTMNDFIRRNEETKSGWCICILIVILVILLVLVILT